MHVFLLAVVVSLVLFLISLTECQKLHMERLQSLWMIAFSPEIVHFCKQIQQCVSSWGNFAPQGTFGNVRRYF